MSEKIRTLHIFHQYLNITENWAFRLMNNLLNTDIVVSSPFFMKCNFYSSKFEYIEFPIKKIEQNNEQYTVKIFNKFVSALLFFFYPRFLEKMSRNIDLMHTHFSFIGYEYRKLAKRLNVPHVVSFYGYDYEYLPYTKPIWEKKYKILFDEADIFLCEGSYSATLMEKIGCKQEKIRIVKLGVDVNKISFKKRSKNSGTLKLLQVASLTGKKGHIYTIKAFVEALRSCPCMELTLVGRNYEGIKEKIQAIIEENGINDKVNILEAVDFEDLHEFMKDYHVFVHPSCHTEERDCEGGAPVVLMDAQATGMPVISTYHCDIPDVVVDNHTGILVMEKDTYGLTEAINRFYFMEDIEYNTFCENAREHIENNYNSQENVKVLKNIYDDIIYNYSKKKYRSNLG